MKLFLMTILLLSCTMEPKYNTPKSPILLEETSNANVINAGWKAFFVSEKMQSVIQTALDNNRDLRIAYLNIETARQNHKIATGNLLPTVNATGSWTQQGVPPAFAFFTPTSMYRVGVGFSAYEIDFFGRLRSLKKSAYASFLASNEAKNIMELSIITSTAAAYTQWSFDRQTLKLIGLALIEQEKKMQTLAKRYDNGNTLHTELIVAQNDYENLKISQSNYEKIAAQDLNALILIMGVSNAALIPNAEPQELKINENLLSLLPSSTLLARPDIRQAEYDLMASNADIGAARAAFFPSINLTTNIGYSSRDLSTLLDYQSWTFNPQINIPIFNGGKNIANLKLSEVRKNVKIATYEKTIQTAFREVQDAVADRESLKQKMESSKQIAKQSRLSFDIMKERNSQGSTSYLSLIASNIAYINAEQSLNIQTQNYISNLITFYKVVGVNVHPQK